MSARITGQGKKAKAPPLPPSPVPAPTAEDLALKAEIAWRIDELAAIVREKNLLRTQRLVEMALRGQAPRDLIDHFSAIGRDYYKLADNGPKKPAFHVIDGGMDQ